MCMLGSVAADCCFMLGRSSLSLLISEMGCCCQLSHVSRDPTVWPAGLSGERRCPFRVCGRKPGEQVWAGWVLPGPPSSRPCRVLCCIPGVCSLPCGPGGYCRACWSLTHILLPSGACPAFSYPVLELVAGVGVVAVGSSPVERKNLSGFSKGAPLRSDLGSHCAWPVSDVVPCLSFPTAGWCQPGTRPVSGVWGLGVGAAELPLKFH